MVPSDNHGIVRHLCEGLDSAAPLLVHPSAITPAELMDLFRKLAEFYELYDCRISIASLVEIYKDHVTADFTRLSTYSLKNDTELPPRIDIITPELRLALNKLAESTRQRVSSYIIPDHERGRTGSLYRGEHSLHMLGKHSALGEAIKELGDKPIDDRSSSGEDFKRKRKKPKRGSSSGGPTRPSGSTNNYARAPFFLRCQRGHRSSDCKVARNKWVEVNTLPTDLHNSAKAVRDMIKKEPTQV